MKKNATIFILLIVVILMLCCSCGGKDISDVPADTGNKMLTDDELDELISRNNPKELQERISTVEDFINYIKRAGFYFVGEEATAEECIANKYGDDIGLTRAFNYILLGDYAECGSIRAEAADNFIFSPYIKVEDTYYMFDVLSYINTRESAKGKHYRTAKSLTEFEDFLYESFETIEIKTEYVASEVMNKVYGTQHSDEEIRELVNQNLTLEEASAKINTVQDAVNYLWERGYHFDYLFTPSMMIEDLDWVWNLSAEFSYEHNAGNCGGTANLINRLLAGDFEEQGYIMQTYNKGGHGFNYFYENGIYIICDFVGPEHAPFADTDVCEKDNFVVTVTDNLDTFKDYFWDLHNGIFDDPESEFYTIHLVAYALDGDDRVPYARKLEDYVETPMGDVPATVYADTIKNCFYPLFVHEGYEIEFNKAPAKEERPPEINIPDNAHLQMN